jgi:hypothetical protein
MRVPERKDDAHGLTRLPPRDAASTSRLYSSHGVSSGTWYVPPGHGLEPRRMHGNRRTLPKWRMNGLISVLAVPGGTASYAVSEKRTSPNDCRVCWT